MKHKGYAKLWGANKVYYGRIVQIVNNIISVWNLHVAPEKEKVKDSPPEKHLADCRQG